MRRMTAHQKTGKVNVEKLAAAMYAAKRFAKEAEERLSYLGIGVKPEVLGIGLHSALEALRERLKEMGE